MILVTQEAQDIALIFHIRVYLGAFVSSLIRSTLLYRITSAAYWWESKPNLYHCLLFHVCPFRPTSSPTPHPPPPSRSPKDGKNFNDSWEDLRDLIGNCDCHSRHLGLFGRRKKKDNVERSTIEKQRGEKETSGFCSNIEIYVFFISFNSHVGWTPGGSH